jgi:protein-S-isoprenylcysteine O-methyltransferase Ste14
MKRYTNSQRGRTTARPVQESDMPHRENDERLAASPNRIPWPPILILSALGLAWVGQAIVTLHVPLPAFVHGLGAVLILAALGLMGWAFIAFARARANIRPDRAATTVIATGPFAWSRNPIYLSEAILLAGLGLWHGSLWYGIALALFGPAVTHFAIRREEAHMAARFGQAWIDYASRVRRWL